MRRTGARGMTLIELLIAISLSVILVGVAAFVFTQSQQIFSRVGGRLDTAQSFRLAAQMLQNDAARMESPRNGTITNGGSTVPWLSITQGQSTLGGSPDFRADTIRFVTHANMSLVYTVGQPPLTADTLVLVTYKLDNVSTGGTYDHGLVRMIDVVTQPTPGTYVVDNTKLPNNSPSGTTSLTMQIAPQARGFLARYMPMGTGTWSPLNANSASGSAFFSGTTSTPPSAIEITIFAPEKVNNTNGLKLSVTRAVEVLAPH